MRKNPYSISQFVCSECGIIIPLPRFKGRKREKKHEKDIYCPNCRQERTFTEYREKDCYRTMAGELVEV